MKVRDEQMETNDKKRVSFSNSEKYCNKKIFFFTLIFPFFGIGSLRGREYMR